MKLIFKAAPVLCASLLAACGGGGGGGGGVATPDSSSNPPTLAFSTSSSSVNPGGSVTLTWQASDATDCDASGGWNGPKGTSGSETVGPFDQNQTFRLSCTGARGGVLGEVSVAVSNSNSNTVSVSLSSSSNRVLKNETVRLQWSSDNAESCAAAGDWSGDLDPQGSFDTQPLERESTFKVTCFADAQSAVSIVTVNVTDPVVRWTPPTQNTDGTALVDLDGFKVHWGSQSRNYDSNLPLDASVTSWNMNLPSGTYRIAVTALNAAGDESGYSNEIERIIP